MHRFRRFAIIGLVIGATSAVALGAIAAGAPKPTLLITPTSLSFGPVVTGTTSPTQSVTITNQGSDPVDMDGTGGNLAPPFSESDDCQGTTLAQGESCHMFYTFSPTADVNVSETASGSWNGRQFSVKVEGTGVSPAFTISPTKIDFGPIVVGRTAAAQVVAVKNVSPSPIVMSGTGLGLDPPFSLSEDCQGKTLAPGKSCHMTFKFKPTETGHANTVSMPTWNGQTDSINLEGVGVNPTLLITPTALQFGSVKKGNDAPEQTVTVTNLSTSPVVMSGTGGDLSAPFSESEDCTGKTLKFGQSCHMTFGFHPTALGKVSASSQGTWNGVSFTIKVLGTGI